MMKTHPYGDSLKDRLLASARDRTWRFDLAGGRIRGVVVNGTRMINEMRSNHELGILETMALGRAYLGVALMCDGLKGDGRIRLAIACSGPIKGLIVEGNAFGEVRGYLQQVPIPIESPPDSFDLSPFFGAGVLSVTHYLQDARQPYTGQVILKYGNIALDLANYHLESEQIPTAFNLGIKFNPQGDVVGAGGLFLQAMPEAEDPETASVAARVAALPSLGEVLAADGDLTDLVRDRFREFSPRFTADRRIEFMCHCNMERLRHLLTLMPVDELADILDKGPFPVEIRCHFCNTRYDFSRDDIQAIYGRRYPNN